MTPLYVSSNSSSDPANWLHVHAGVPRVADGEERPPRLLQECLDEDQRGGGSSWGTGPAHNV